MEEVKKLIKIFNNAFNMLNRDIIQTTITKEQVLAIENLINKNKELEKMVELMAKDIAENDIEDICKIVGDDPHCTEYTEEGKCVECVINYFKKKASDENVSKR